MIPKPASTAGFFIYFGFVGHNDRVSVQINKYIWVLSFVSSEYNSIH